MLCFDCKHFHTVKGTRPSEEINTCTDSDVPFTFITFRVTECSSFKPYNEMSLYAMTRIAHILTTKRGRIVGFKSHDEFSREHPSEPILPNY